MRNRSPAKAPSTRALEAIAPNSKEVPTRCPYPVGRSGTRRTVRASVSVAVAYAVAAGSGYVGSMTSDPLAPYRSKRDASRTPEPVPPAGPVTTGHDNTFVIQEHHARALHWDFRLERGGVLVSWAVPKGLPTDPSTNRLAVPTEDHPLDYASFEGTIGEGEYGGGSVTIWDRGTYETLEWSDGKVKVVLHGERVQGRFALFRTTGGSWMMHRMDDVSPQWEPLPHDLTPMTAVLREQLPPEDGRWCFEMKWDGIRALVHIEGGRGRIVSRNDHVVTDRYPELREMAASLGARPVVLDGEIVALDREGRPSFAALQPRINVTNAAEIRRLSESAPVTFFAFDVLHLDGASTVELPYVERRRLLEGLGLVGSGWRTPPFWESDGAAVQAAAADQHLEGVMAKRRDSPYLPGRRSDTWVKVKNLRTQEVVIGGWREGSGNRSGRLGALLLGIPGVDGLRYVGKVGTGFREAELAALTERLERIGSPTSPFETALPSADRAGARWVEPILVGEVRFAEWTRDGRLRQPAWRGIRPDKDPHDVAVETPVNNRRATPDAHHRRSSMPWVVLDEP